MRPRSLAAAGMAAAALSAALVAAPAAQAQEAATPFAATTLAVSADGEVRAAPDIAVLTVGVSASAPTAAQALAQMRARLAATIAALKTSGEADRDVQTSALDLNPRYDGGSDRPRTLSGYDASSQVTVVVRDVARTGATLDAAVAQGANTVEGVGFDLADRTPAEDAARRAAVAALGARARLLAEAAGLHVKRLVSLTDGGGGSPAPVPMLRRMAMAARAPTEVEPGELHVRATVSAVYELER